MKKIFLTIAIFSTVNNLYGFSVLPTGHYIPIDSINQTHCGRLINVNLVNKKIDLIINNKSITFVQKYDIDTTQNGMVFTYKFLLNKNDTAYSLRLNELLSFNDDSIFVSAEYAPTIYLNNIYRNGFRVDYNHIHSANINRIPISRADLLGITVTPTKKEMAKRDRRMFWTIIGSGVIITTISILANRSDMKK